MTLADACSDFGFIEHGEPITDATKRLLARVEWYGRDDYPIKYPQEHIERLRKAAKAALDNPDDASIARDLITLAEAMREHYDSDWKVPLPPPLDK